MTRESEHSIEIKRAAVGTRSRLLSKSQLSKPQAVLRSFGEVAFLVVVTVVVLVVVLDTVVLVFEIDGVLTGLGAGVFIDGRSQISAK